MRKLKTLLEETRTFRRFQQDKLVSPTTLHDLLDLARLGGSARNCQPWQYLPITDPERCQNIFPYLGWAGYLQDWKGPIDGERPAAYIMCFLNSKWLKGPEREAYFDLGIASQNLLLGGQTIGIGGCRIGAFSPKLESIFSLQENLKLALVIALGYPNENVTLEEQTSENDVQYWRDTDGMHHVPKRPLRDILISEG